MTHLTTLDEIKQNITLLASREESDAQHLSQPGKRPGTIVFVDCSYRL